MTYRLEVIALSCVRGDRPLFTDLSFMAASGELLHVVGANGSGKTTLLRTICGLTRPASGEICWQGRAVQALGDDYRRDLAYVGHLDGIQGELTPAENLKALACQAPGEQSGGGRATTVATRIDAALERLGLDGLRSFPSKVLSQGQKRRLSLARLLLAPRPLWLLDEPFTALDARSSMLLNEILTAHLAGGGIAVLASHQPLTLAAARYLDLEHGGRPATDTTAPIPVATCRASERNRA